MLALYVALMLFWFKALGEFSPHLETWVRHAPIGMCTTKLIQIILTAPVYKIGLQISEKQTLYFGISAPTSENKLKMIGMGYGWGGKRKKLITFF